MRIIRGKFKGKKIYPPKNFKARPTTDFAKEALFNILNSNYDITKYDVLDLFAGTGNISLEFLSEGCKSITAVEISKYYTFHIKKMFDEMFPLKGNIICADAFSYAETENLNFDVIFADPPFNYEKIKELPEIILKNPTVKSNVLLILEHSKKNDFSDCEYFKESRKYGNIRFSFFKKS